MFLSAGGAFDMTTPLQMRLLGEVALETASTGLSIEDIVVWMRKIFDL
jgi:hypothetical protein